MPADLKKIVSDGLEFTEVKADGHCFYHALEYCLPDKKVDGLRQEIGSEIRKNRDKYQGFLLEDLDSFAFKVQTTSKWAGDVEISAFHKLYPNYCIVAIDPKGIVSSSLDTKNIGNKQIIFMAYNGYNHYDYYTVKPGKNAREILNELIANQPKSQVKAAVTESKESEVSEAKYLDAWRDEVETKIKAAKTAAAVSNPLIYHYLDKNNTVQTFFAQSKEDIASLDEKLVKAIDKGEIDIDSLPKLPPKAKK